MTNNKTILVTGGSGFIGSNLVDELILQDFKVVVIDKEIPKFRNPKAKYYIINLINEKISKVFEENKIDIVVHLAAQTSVNISVKYPKQDSSDNILATLNLLECCKKYNVSKIVASSSAAVYGEPVSLPISEEHPLMPMSPYALSKCTMEAYIKMSGLDYMIYRFSNVYGPRQANSSESGVISIFTNNMINNRATTIYGDGEQYRDFIYVKDVVDCIIKSLNSKFKNEIVNLSTNSKITINELCNVLKELTNCTLAPVYLDKRKSDIKESILDNTKMKKFGLRADTKLTDGLKQTIDFYKEQSSAGPKILVIIPARGGSVGIPRKNLRSLNGKPLISYSIQNALKSKYNLDIYVSSDDDEILYISQKLGAQIHKRDASIADGATTLDPVIYDAYKKISEMNNTDYELIVTLQPTSPLLRTSSLDKAIEKMLNDTNIDTIISAKDTTHLSWSKQDDKFVPNYEKRVNRQYLPPVYTETGGFLITRSDIISENNRIGQNVELAVLKNPEEYIDIDTYEDFYLANYYLKRKNIVFVVSGYKQIGFGHIYRALLLANNITNHNIKFLVTKNSKEGFEKLQQYTYESYFQQNENIIDDILELKADVVINDILDTDEAYILALKNNDIKVINFEDLGSGSAKADIVINALYNVSNKNPNTYWGADYFCARDEFIISKPKTIEEDVKEILITFGGTDPNNLTLKVLDSIYEYCQSQNININVVLGLGYDNKATLSKFKDINIYQDIKSMSDFMEKADLIYTACGRTVYETACIGTPCIVMAQNERELTHKFASKENGFENLGLGINVDNNKILSVSKSIITNSKKRHEMSKRMLSKDLKNGINRTTTLILNEVEE